MDQQDHPVSKDVKERPAWAASRVVKVTLACKDTLEYLDRKVRKVALDSQVTVDLSDHREILGRLDHLAGMVLLDLRVPLEILDLLDSLDCKAKWDSPDSKELLDLLVCS